MIRESFLDLRFYLEHLDKRYTEVHVCDIAEDETQAEHCTNWHNSTPDSSISIVLEF